MEKACGTCVHCADCHGHYLTNDGVCLRIGVSVKKDTSRRSLAPCGIRWDGEVGEYGPGLWEERTDTLEQRYAQLEKTLKEMWYWVRKTAYAEQGYLTVSELKEYARQFKECGVILDD